MNAPSSTDTATVRVKGSLGWCELDATLTVPAGPTRLSELLPLLQNLSDKIVATAEEAARQQGRNVSCRKGCGACCRQSVPLSPVEARDIARLVHQLPEPRQTEIRGRFTAARQRLEAAGLWQQLEERQTWPKERVLQFAHEYFDQQVPCPFLEDESCSIHLERPLACREFLVTSPPENCSNPTRETVEGLPLPAKVWVAAARCEPLASGGPHLNWVPLIQSLEWSAANPELPANEDGPEVMRRVLEALTK